MSFDAGSIVSKLILDKKGFDASVKVVKKGVKDLGKYVDKNSDKIKHMGRTMTIAGGAMVGALGLAVKSAISFNKQMANVATLVPNSTKRILELKKGVQDLAIETGKSTTDISDGLYQVISAFGDTAETAEILETNVLAAAAGMATTSDAIFLTSAVMKGYGDVSAESTKKVADLAFQTVKLGQTTFPELARSMGRAIPVAAKLGVTQEELFAGFATLTGVTGDATMVTTQLFAAMNSIMKPSKDMSIAIDKLGYTSAETMVEELGLVGSMRALVKTTDGSVESVGKLVPNIRALPAVFALTGGQAEVFDQKLIKMNDSAGAMDEAFKEMSEGINKTGFNMGQLGQMTSVLTQRIGDSLAPVLGDLVLSAGKIVTKLSEWINEHPKLTAIIAKAALGIGALMVALGPLLMALPGLIKALPLVKKGFGKLPIVLKTLKGSISGVGGLLKSLPAVAMAAFAGWEVGKAIGKIKILGKSIDDHVVGAFDNAIEALGLFRSKAELTGETAEKLAGRAKFLAKHEKKMADMTKTAKDALVKLNKKGLKPAKDALIKLNKKGLEPTKELISEVIEETETWIDYIADMGLKTVEEKSDRVEELEGYIDDLSKAYKYGKLDLTTYTKALNKASDEIDDLSTVISTTALPAFRDMSGVLDTAVGEMEDRFPDITKVVETEAGKIGGKKDSIFDTLADGLKTKWATTMGDIIKGTTTWKDGLKGIWDAVKTQFTDMVGALVTKWITGFIGDTLSSLVSTFVPGVKSAMGEASGAAGTAATSIGASMALAFDVGIVVAWATATWSFIKGWGDKVNIHWEEQKGHIHDYIEKLKEMGATWREIQEMMVEHGWATPKPGPKGSGDKLPGRGGGEDARGGGWGSGKWATGFEGIVDQPIRPLIGEAGPEYVSVQPLSGKGSAKPSGNVTVNNYINLNGTIITDREYTRNRMMPEIISALEANLEKTKMKQILGIA